MRRALVLFALLSSAAALSMGCEDPPLPEEPLPPRDPELVPASELELPERSDEPVVNVEAEEEAEEINLRELPPGPRDPELLRLLRAYTPREYSPARHDQALIAIAQRTVTVAAECGDLETAREHVDGAAEELVESWAELDRLRAAGEDLDDAEDQERAAWDGARDAMRRVRDACDEPGVLGPAVLTVERYAPQTR